ncbi:PREDICTED: pentatricopeptide repeat-containing protein At3g05340-like [Camelina sativa]|uniref:Pentatricopeptide repeat-containing protein At3g05340-like n=1 Tax=Camelina sativa TaxID=90675 RepID=A0ABM0W0Q5_CAMSA|nr:PREDICTED: pentatricopeptide repeat-containing protein At3g05340-like [Camelina sativa]
MNSRWVIQKLTSHPPLCLSTILCPSKLLIRQSQVSTFLLNHVDMSLLLSICGREGWFPHLGPCLHASIIKNPEFFEPVDADIHRNALVVWNSLLSQYVKCGKLVDALQLFDEMPMRDVISQNILFYGFLRNRETESGFVLLKRMLGSGGFDQATLTIVLSVCVTPEFCLVTKMIHALAVLSGYYDKDISVGNKLITSYFKCGCSVSARRVFDEMASHRNVITWTAVVSGLIENELHEDGLRLFSLMRRGLVHPNSVTYLSALAACSGSQRIVEGQQIHALLWKFGIESELCIESALMDMYSKCGSIEDAWKIFESTDEVDEVSMTVILVGLAQNGSEEEAIQFFIRMLQAGVEIDANVVSAVLGVSFVDNSLGLGKQLHSLVIKRKFSGNTFVNNGLINMYPKCGDLIDSLTVFRRMPKRNYVSWNSMIAAFARHGNGLAALNLYEEMITQDVKPTDVTFLSLLHACSHVGLIDKGRELLNVMQDVHGIEPRTEHYACIIDMFGRAGLLKEAKSFIDSLPIKPDYKIWQALLGACSFHGETEVGKYAAEQLIQTAPDSSAAHILMANIYSSRGKWKERAKTIKRMKAMGVTKETGISSIEIENKTHSFVVGDQLHPQAEAIYDVLAELFPVMVDEGYRPDKRFILCYTGGDRNGINTMEGLHVFASVPRISFFSNSRNSKSQRFIPSCREKSREDPLSSSSPYSILGVEPSCSSSELKAAFRAKVKQYHPDVNRERSNSDIMIRRIIQAYEMLTNYSRSEIIEGECLDPFDHPECEALDVFVNEVLCVGKRCSYPCFKTAPQVFSCDTTGTARAMSQGHGEDNRLQSAVNQCPRNCIHYVTPSQRIILEELLDSVLGKPYDCSAESEFLYALIVKAQFENNRYQKPKKKQPESSGKHVDWF